MPVDFRPLDDQEETKGVRFTPTGQQTAPQGSATQEDGPGFLATAAREIARPFARVGANLFRAGQLATGRDVDPSEPVNVPFVGETRPVGQEGSFGQRLRDALGTGTELASTVVPAGRAPSIAANTLRGAVGQGVKTGAQAGAAGGAAFGAGRTAQDPEASAGQIAGAAVQGGVAGAAGGAALGGGIAVPAAARQRFLPTQPEAINQLKEGYDTLFQSTKAANKRVEKSRKRGKEPSTFLAEKGLAPEVTPDGKVNTETVREQLRQEMNDLDDLLTEGLASTDATVPLTMVREKAVQALDNPKTRADGSVFQRQEAANSIFDVYEQIYGEQVPLNILNEIKRAQYNLTKSFDATKPAFAQDVNYKIAAAARESIEETATDLPVADLNAYYGDHIDALGLLEHIHGNAVKGGRLGQGFARMAGAIVGSGAGGVAGPLGHVAGGVAGDVVAGAIQRRSMQNSVLGPSAMKVLTNTPREQADVIRRFVQSSQPK